MLWGGELEFCLPGFLGELVRAGRELGGLGDLNFPDLTSSEEVFGITSGAAAISGCKLRMSSCSSYGTILFAV